jgi:hypothetical protein
VTTNNRGSDCGNSQSKEVIILTRGEILRARRTQRMWLNEAKKRGDVKAEIMLENVIKRTERMLAKCKRI